MSKSVKRVRTALAHAGLKDTVQEMTVSTKSAQDAAHALGVSVDQIAKSIVMRGSQSGHLYLFITAGGNRVSPQRSAECIGEAIARADATTIRARTGFAIGGVAPIGHLSPIRTLFDSRLSDFTTIWAAGGTPRHMFEIRPSELLTISQARVLPFTENGDPPAAPNRAGPRTASELSETLGDIDKTAEAAWKTLWPS